MDIPLIMVSRLPINKVLSDVSLFAFLRTWFHSLQCDPELTFLSAEVMIESNASFRLHDLNQTGAVVIYKLRKVSCVLSACHF